MEPERNADLRLMHPAAVAKFRGMYDALQEGYRRGDTDTLFEPFEAYRSPVRQDFLFRKRPIVTRARAWQSAHQYGMAADFVPFEIVDDRGDVHKGWNWSDQADWKYLKERAEAWGLAAPLGWDKAHVVYPGWQKLRDLRL